MSKPFSQSCENNKQAILSVIERYFKAGDKVLEIAAGTGQHALFFEENLPDVIWQPSDIRSNLNTTIVGLEGSSNNILEPLALDVQQQNWPLVSTDGVFSANSLHIMSYLAVEDFFKGLGEVVNSKGFVCVYGPFKYKGEFTSQSNANFDLWLKERNPLSGIRDFESANALAKTAGLDFVEDKQMPANNQLLVWQKY